MIREIRKKAKELLEYGELDVVIGYGEGSDPSRTTPVFIRNPEDVEKLIFDARCINSLPLYLNKRHEFPRKGWQKTGIVGKGCDIRAITQLIAENQLTREEIYIFGVPCDGVVSHPENWDGSLNEGNCAGKCAACDVKIPADADFYAAGELPQVDRSEPYQPVRRSWSICWGWIRMPASPSGVMILTAASSATPAARCAPTAPAISASPTVPSLTGSIRRLTRKGSSPGI